jgi:8-oxo-dGTP diphosphatase
MAYTYPYPRPAVTVDAVILAPGESVHEVLLIRRGNEPFQGMWALPGGFMDLDEELEDAAARELEEETGLTGIAMTELGIFGKIGRDPRGRTIGVAFMAVLENKAPARAGDDAAAVSWFPLDALPALAFDHDRILARAREKLLSPG